MLEVVVSDEVVDEVDEPPFEQPPIFILAVFSSDVVVVSIRAAKWRRVCRSWRSELRSESEMLPVGLVSVSIVDELSVRSSNCCSKVGTAGAA